MYLHQETMNIKNKGGTKTQKLFVIAASVCLLAVFLPGSARGGVSKGEVSKGRLKVSGVGFQVSGSKSVNTET
jgi:hypothetical protein